MLGHIKKLEIQILNKSSFIHSVSYKRPLFTIILLLMVFLLSACGGARQAGNWPSVSATDSHVYVAFAGDVVSLDVANQKEAWRFQGEGAVEFYAPPEVVPEEETVYLADFGRSGGILSGGALIVSMYALEDGTSNPPITRWVKEDVIDGRIVAGLQIVDDLIFTGTSNNKIIAVSRNDGSLIWESPTENAIWSQPAGLNDTIFVTSIDRNIYAINRTDGSEKWTHTLNGAGSGSPVVSADERLVYAGSFGGEVIALNVDDGSEVWKAAADDWVWGAPVQIDNVLIYGDVSGNVYAVDSDTGASIWQATVNDSIVGDIVADGSTILVASGNEETFVGHVTAFSIAGEELWETQTTAHIQSSPALMGDSGQLAVVFGDVTNDVTLGVNIIDTANGSIGWTWTLTEAEAE